MVIMPHQASRGGANTGRIPDEPASTDVAPLVFSNGEFDLTFKPDGGGGWHIPAAPVAYALGFGSARDMLRSLPDSHKGWETVPTLGGDQRVYHVTLPGFLQVVGQRQPGRVKDAAVRATVERFQRWVFDDVVTSVVTTGSYAVPSHAPTPATAVTVPQTYKEALQHLLAKVEENETLTRELEASQTQVAELAPSAEAWDTMSSAKGGVSITAAAKTLKSSGCRIEPKELFTYLAGKRWIYRAGHVGAWTPYQPVLNSGWMVEKLGGWHSDPATGEQKQNAPSARITATGMERLRSMLIAERGSWMSPQMAMAPWGAQ